MRPFEGIKVIDVTHVLAGPFAAYQLAVLGADVIKVEHPDEPDQSRGSGTDKALNRRNMGTAFLTQASNKRSIALDLKTPADREILKKLVTGSVALTLLGAEYQFRTAYAARGPVEGGVLRGDLLVIGRGDPSMSDHMRGDVMQTMKALPDSLRAHDIRYVAFDYATEAGVPQTGELAALARYNTHPWAHAIVTLLFDFQNNLKELGRTRKRVYDDGASFVVDLQQRADAASASHTLSAR